MLTPPGVKQSSARRSIHLSLMIVVEPFTVHGSICCDFFIPVPKRLSELAAWRTWCLESAPPAGGLESRAKPPRIPAEVLHRRRGIENHVLRHAIAHGEVGVRNE